MTRIFLFVSAMVSPVVLALVYISVATGASSSNVVTRPSSPMTATTPAAGGSMAGMAGMASAGAPVARLDLTILTGGMIGHTEFPAFVPSDFTLPAHSTVIITVTNFDDATPLPKGAEQYAKVTGTLDGAATVTPIKAGDPNGSAGATKSVTSLKPADVSHTFTIPALGINVPIAAHARVVFVIHTGAPGRYDWRCFVPCGADPMGWGTAMAAKRGFMQGTLTVE
jgi:hypothetical protein